MVDGNGHVPSLALLHMVPQDASESENSSPSTPRNGHFKSHPYHPIEDVVERSSHEFVLSTTTQAPCASDTDNMNVTPISTLRSMSSTMLPKPIQGKTMEQVQTMRLCF